MQERAETSPLFCQKGIAASHAQMPRIPRIRLGYDVDMDQVRTASLRSLAVVAATGSDARSFLQGQLSNDLLGIERHPGMLAAHCNRQGRVLATMRLAARDGAVLLVLPEKLAGTLVAQLSHYVLRADVRFEVRRDIAVSGLIDAEPDARWSQAGAAAAGVSMMVASPRRILLAGAQAALDAVLGAVPSGSPDDWERACIADGEPAIHPETAALWLPQMLNLDLVGGLSFSKGCYVGQEIVARSQHLGRIKRRMLRYAGPAGLELRPAQPLFRGEILAGQVVTSARDAAATHCLAVVDLRYCSDLLGAMPGGSEFVPADLPYAIPAPEAAGGG
jgi:folate-binding protein YgfZ